jgi:dimeric dUTPase (all-alpha-NTP-PPase superfamily)
LEKAYFAKNQINYQRQENNYWWFGSDV